MGKYLVQAGEAAGVVKRVEPRPDAKGVEFVEKAASGLNTIFAANDPAPRSRTQQSDQRPTRRTLGRTEQSQRRPVRRATLLGN